MQILFRGEKHVSHSQFYLGTGTEPVDGYDMTHGFGGQRNGLCGAAEAGQLILVTGLHTGKVPVTVELDDDPPPIPDAQDVVEVSFPITRGPVGLFTGSLDDHAELALAPDIYRVRYCATGMDDARAADCRMDDDPALDRYLLQFWPAPTQPDQVLRSGSEIARYWHDNAAGLPVPTQTSSERARQRAHDPKHARKRLIYLNLLWAGQQPPGPLGAVELARTVVLLDRDLADHVVALPPDRQRTLACWTAHRAVTDAGLGRIEWIAEALDRLGREPLPVVFSDDSTALEALCATPGIPCSVVTSPDEHRAPVLAQAMALPALAAATHPDPTIALLETLHHAIIAAGEEGFRGLLADLRSGSGLDQRRA